MITSVSLDNFQGFSQRTTLRMAPLTLVFGPNSSGKSSVLRALRFLSQSFTPNEKLASSTFLPDGFAVKLASFINLVSKHETSRIVTLGLTLDIAPGRFAFHTAEFSFDQSMQLTALRLDGNGRDESTFSLQFAPKDPHDLSSEKQWQIAESSFEDFEEYLRNVREQLVEDISSSTPPPTIARHIKAAAQDANNPVPSEQLLKDVAALRWPDATPEFTMEAFTPRFVPDSLGSARNLANGGLQELFQRRVVLGWTRFLGKIQLSLLPETLTHIPPLRAIPGRVQVVSSGKISHTSTAQTLSNSAARQQASEWLERITHGQYGLDFITLTGETGAIFGDLGALVLREVGTGTLISFEDAGVGLSQVLPILEWLATSALAESEQNPQNRIASPSKLLLVEQPELHLHPRMQGEVMDLLIGSINNADKPTQIIAETHSEAFVLRLLSAIRRGEISSELVSVLYVDKDSTTGVSRVRELEISPSGEFMDTWPESFSEVRIGQSRS